MRQGEGDERAWASALAIGGHSCANWEAFRGDVTAIEAELAKTGDCLSDQARMVLAAEHFEPPGWYAEIGIVEPIDGPRPLEPGVHEGRFVLREITPYANQETARWDVEHDLAADVVEIEIDDAGGRVQGRLSLVAYDQSHAGGSWEDEDELELTVVFNADPCSL